MTRLCLVLVLMGAMVGCCHTEYSKELTEPATVEQTIFTPATHGTGVGPVTGGKGGLTVVSVDTSPVYAVVFECQHGKFIVENEAVWRYLKQGDHVLVNYREVYCHKADGLHLKKYDFRSVRKIDANGK